MTVATTPATITYNGKEYAVQTNPKSDIRPFFFVGSRGGRYDLYQNQKQANLYFVLKCGKTTWYRRNGIAFQQVG